MISRETAADDDRPPVDREYTASAVRRDLLHAVDDCIALVLATDVVWLKHSVAIHLQDEYTCTGLERHMAMGYTGTRSVFHVSEDCENLVGEPKEVAESKALKFGYFYCNKCMME